MLRLNQLMQQLPREIDCGVIMSLPIGSILLDFRPVRGC